MSSSKKGTPKQRASETKVKIVASEQESAQSSTPIIESPSSQEGTYRTILIKTSPEEIPSDPIHILVDDGTPQKRLASLISKCKEIQINNPNIIKKYYNTTRHFNYLRHYQNL